MIKEFSGEYGSKSDEDVVLEYVYIISEIILPYNDFDGEQMIRYPSFAPSIYKKRYNENLFEIKNKSGFTFTNYQKNKDIQELLTYFELDSEKFWHLLLFVYDYANGNSISGNKILTTPRNQIKEFINLVKSNGTDEGFFEIGNEYYSDNMELTLKIGKKKVVINNDTAINLITTASEHFLNKEQDNILLDCGMIIMNEPINESYTFFAYIFAKTMIDFFNSQEHIKSKRRSGANLSDKEKILISTLLNFTEIVYSKSIIEDNDYLKAILKRFKNHNKKISNKYYSIFNLP